MSKKKQHSAKTAKTAKTGAAKPDPQAIAADTRRRRIAVIAFAFSGMAALMYEVLWTRELSLVFGSTVYAVSMMLAAFMSGLSLGAFLGGRWADRSKDLIALFGRLEFGIAIFGLLSLPLVQVLPDVYFFVYDTIRPPFAVFFVIQMFLSFMIMLIPTTFMGATFPVVSKLNTSALDELGTDVGNVYSINTLGSIAGSLGTGFLFIPLIGVKATTFAAAALNLAVALVVTGISQTGFKIPRKTMAIGIIGLAIALGSGALVGQSAYAHSFYRIGDFGTYAEYEEYRDALVTKYFADDVHGRVVVFETPDGERHLQNSGKVEGSTAILDRQTTSLLALVPMAASENPESVMVVGLGTGFTSLAALDAGARYVDTVEINDSVLEASRLFVGSDVEDNPRSEIHVTDARNYLNVTDRTYDVITSEPSYPLSTHVSHLFTSEFYELAKSRLNDDGVLCQWIPRYLLSDEDTLMMLKTFHDVFPEVYMWGSNQGADEAVDMLLIGVNGDRVIDPAVVQARVESMSDLELDFGFFGSPADIAAAVADEDILVNTDDLPHLEFHTPRNQIEFYREGMEALGER